MEEITLNMHMHSRYSDGSGSHTEIARAAMHSGLDAIIVTDHNIWVKGVEGYYEHKGKHVLVLIGEEIHDPLRAPQKNHLLTFGVEKEMAPFARDPQLLINQIKQHSGVSFIAHPNDPALPLFGEGDFSWVDWKVDGFTGIELWNGFSELKSVVRNYFDAIFYAFYPQAIAQGPLAATLTQWDELLSRGQKVVAIGGSDAHALKKSLGPIHRTIFPYTYHFRSINTHLLLPQPMEGIYEPDRRNILDALRAGHAFVGYDLPASTRGFRFTAQGKDRIAQMGDTISIGDGVTLQIRMPRVTECVLIKDGKPIKTWHKREITSYITTEPGVYRVEAYLSYLGRRRGWIYSNPIYIRGQGEK